MPEAFAQSLTMKKVLDTFREEVLLTVHFRGQETVVVRKQNILHILRFLRDDPDLQYNFLMDISGVDYLSYPDPAYRRFGRFAVVYQLYSQKSNSRFRVKAMVPEDDLTIDSAYPLWKIADWTEREYYDMFGVTFNGHPDHRRILTPEGFTAFPLRKDYPVRGRGERDSFPRIERGWKRAVHPADLFPQDAPVQAPRPRQPENVRKPEEKPEPTISSNDPHPHAANRTLP